MRLRKLICAGMAAVMLAGCGSSGTSASTEEESYTYVIATETDLNTMDHNLMTDGTSFVMGGMCFEGLTKVDENGDIVAGLAESWDISDDGLVYTFHIREDAYWSNGTQVTAHDFVYSWQRLVDPDTGSEYAFIVDTIHVLNAAECMTGEKDVSELGVEATDDFTFVVTLSLPCNYLLSLMKHGSFYPLNQEYYEEHADTYAQSPEDMIYCGPYEMTGWEQGNEYTFTKRDDYYDVDEEAVDTVVFKYIQDTQSAMLSYEQGDIDYVSLQSDQVDAYSDEEGFYSNLQAFSWYLSINFEVESLNNLNLRKALSYAVDRDAIAESVLKDGSVAAEGLVPEGLDAGPTGNDFREDAGSLVSYDPDLAAEYYAAAVEELGGDVTLELLFEDSEASKAVAENLQSQIQTNCPGITITLLSKPKKTRLELMSNGEYEIALTRWGADYSDPQTYMDLFLEGASNNSGNYLSEEYNALVMAGDSGEDAVDASARWQDYIDAEALLVAEDYAIVPIYQDGSSVMMNPEYEGVVYQTVGGYIYTHIHRVSE